MCLLVVSARNLIQTFLSNKGRIYWLLTKPRESRADAKSNLSCPSKPQAWVASGLPSLSLLPRARPTSTSTFAFLFSSSAYSKWHWIQLPASSRSSLPLPLIAHICLPAVVVSSMRKGSHWHFSVLTHTLMTWLRNYRYSWWSENVPFWDRPYFILPHFLLHLSGSQFFTIINNSNENLSACYMLFSESIDFQKWNYRVER